MISQNFVFLLILLLVSFEPVKVQETTEKQDELPKNTEANISTTSTFPSVTSTTNSPSSLPIDKNVEQEKKAKDIEQKLESCIFYKVHNVSRLNIEPQYSNLGDCRLNSPHLNVIDDEESNTELPLYKDGNNALQVVVRSESSNSFELTLFWIKLNETIHKSMDSYRIWLSVYEDFQLIGNVAIIDRLIINKTKEIKFTNLTDLKSSTYSLKFGKVQYFRNFDLLKSETSSENFFKSYVDEEQFYVIKNVYKSTRPVTMNSNSQIVIYTIASFLLLALVVGLLYYRRDKFRSLISNRFDTVPRHQNSKYVRKSNGPTINISHHQNNNSFNDSPFEHQFLKNTARLNNGNRTPTGFNYLSNGTGRDKRSLSTLNISRVIEQSVATIKKRTSLKPMSPASTEEFDLQKMDSKYSHSISLIEFLPLLNELNKPNSQRMFNEFMQLNILTSHSGGNTLKKNSNKIARISKNLQKNKDGCVLPFDRSRVVLQMNVFLTSDYINASFVPGCDSKKEYIACQCPMKSTTYAFWLMCLQQNVRYIVMTTQLVDSFTTMEKYWPDFVVEDAESFKQIENIVIRLLDKRKFINYTVRTFELKMNDECKIIKHFQLTGWNEFENPESVAMIIDFMRVFHEEIGFNDHTNENSNEISINPIVVHCSNGINKTAVFIAIDRIYVQLKRGKNDHIDIFGTVIQMRQYRPSMIQNEAQYKFIYETVGQLIRQMYPDIVKQMEFDRSLDEINLKETNDFDANNNLDSSNNGQICLFDELKKLNNNKPAIQVNGYTNQTFVSHDENV